MQENLADLKRRCEVLGIPVKQSGKRPAKADYVGALQKHFLAKDFPQGLPYQEESPMLCFAYWNLKPEEQQEIWKDGNGWVAQEKLNGCRAIVHFVKGKGIYAHSRTVSLKTFRFQNLEDHFLFGTQVPEFSATVDVEMIVEKAIDTRAYTAKGEVTQTSLHSTTAILHLEAEASKRLQRDQSAPLGFRVFDILSWQGEDLKGRKLEDRNRYLSEFFSQLRHYPELSGAFSWVTWQTTNKKQYFEQVVKRGGEGVVLKNMQASYEASTSRRRDAWVKVKKRQEWDAFVSGFIPGEPGTGWEKYVGALEFSVYVEGGTHVIGMASNLTMEQRKAMTEWGPETKAPLLKKEWYGKVAQISGQDITPRVLRLSHCTIDRWRDQAGDEKRAQDCRASMADLRQAAVWVG